jgi:hypothetical protein
MSTKQTLLQQIDNFMKELVSIFPKNGDILLFSEKYNLIRSANSSLIIQYFIQYVYPHKTRILNQEESYFLDGG